MAALSVIFSRFHRRTRPGIMSQDSDTELVQAAAELILAQLGPYHTEEVYRNALQIELKATSELVMLHYRGMRVGTQQLDLVWRRYHV